MIFSQLKIGEFFLMQSMFAWESQPTSLVGIRVVVPNEAVKARQTAVSKKIGAIQSFGSQFSILIFF